MTAPKRWILRAVSTDTADIVIRFGCAGTGNAASCVLSCESEISTHARARATDDAEVAMDEMRCLGARESDCDCRPSSRDGESPPSSASTRRGPSGRPSHARALCFPSPWCAGLLPVLPGLSVLDPPEPARPRACCVRGTSPAAGRSITPTAPRLDRLLIDARKAVGLASDVAAGT